MNALLPQLHDRLALTTTWFMLIIALWALVQWVRNRPLGSSWFGAAAIAELTIVIQGLLGAWLYLIAGMSNALPRPYIHVLYGVVAVITLPASWSYFGNLPDERVRSLAMAVTCLFLWGILQRATTTAIYLPPGL